MRTCLELCSGQGGSTAGIMRAGYTVTAVDTNANHLRRNPADHKIHGDAFEVLAEIGSHFDLVWAGWPCQDYSAGTRAARAHGIPTGHQRLISAGRTAMQANGKPWVIENVEGARSELNGPVTLCGTMFDLHATDDDGTPLIMLRHRLFESSHLLLAPEHRPHPKNVQFAGSYGGARRNAHDARHERHGGYVPAKHVQAAMLGIDSNWMTEQGQYLSIPPAYAELIASQLLNQTHAQQPKETNR